MSPASTVVGLVALAALAATPFLFRMVRISDGTGAVVVRYGRIRAEWGPGMHLLSPGSRIVCYPTLLQMHPGGPQGFQANVATKDGLYVNVDIRMHYRVSVAREFVAQFGMPAAARKVVPTNPLAFGHTSVMESALMAGLREQAAPRTLGEVLSQGFNEPALRESVGRTLQGRGIQLQDVRVERIDCPEAFRVTALEVTRMNAQKQQLENIAQVVQGDKEKMVEILHILQGQSSLVGDKIEQRRRAEADAEGYGRLRERLGDEDAARLRKMQAMEKVPRAVQFDQGSLDR